MKKLFIHCGLHKTGTTSLQDYFHKNSSFFLSNNILYPNLGVPKGLGGQHNIAWELTKDHRFKTRLGTLKKLFSVIKNFDGNVVLSSEDFEGSLLHVERWKYFIDQAKLINYRVTFVIYLRDPIKYLESLYFETLKLGSDRDYTKIVTEILLTNKLNYKEWEFCFDYSEIKKSLSAIHGAEVVFRNYENLLSGSTIFDFLDLIGINENLIKNNSTINKNIKANRALPLNISLVQYIRNQQKYWYQIKSRRKKVEKIISYMLKENKSEAILPQRYQELFYEKFHQNYEFFKFNNFDFDKKNPANNFYSIENKKEFIDVSRIFSSKTYEVYKRFEKYTDIYGNFFENDEKNKKIRKHIEKWRSWIKISN